MEELRWFCRIADAAGVVNAGLFVFTYA